jgi:hypothetical protein
VLVSRFASGRPADIPSSLSQEDMHRAYERPPHRRQHSRCTGPEGAQKWIIGARHPAQSGSAADRPESAIRIAPPGRSWSCCPGGGHVS